jgi:hypothetical protein
MELKSKVTAVVSAAVLIGGVGLSLAGPAVASSGPCSGNQEATITETVNHWNVPVNSSEVTDSYGHSKDFCVLPVGGNDNKIAFREYGTSICATYISNGNTVQLRSCDQANNASQRWAPYEYTNGAITNTYLWVASDPSSVLRGIGGDNAVFLTTNLSMNGESWTVHCIANCSSPL